MSVTLTAREFNQDSGRAKKAASDGPVFITDRGQPSYVLLSIETYRQLSASGPSLAELVSMPGDEPIAFDPPRLEMALRPADLS